MANKFSALQSVMDILKEVGKLPRKNTKIFFFIFLSTLISSILFDLALTYPMKSASTNTIPLQSMDSAKQDYYLNQTIPLQNMDPAKPDNFKQFRYQFSIDKNTMDIIFIELVFIFLMSALTLYSIMTTIYVSAMSYVGRDDFKLKDLFTKIKKNWIRPVITCFYITLISIGVYVALLLLLPLLLLIIRSKTSLFVVFTIGIILVILAIFLNMYLASVFILSTVASVLEESYGLQAIGKGVQLHSGRKAIGFVLTFIVMILFGLNILVSMITIHESVAINLLISFCGMIFDITVTILSVMIYTVFYFDCKQTHGEDLESFEENKGYTMGYTKLSTVALVDYSSLP